MAREFQTEIHPVLWDALESGEKSFLVLPYGLYQSGDLLRVYKLLNYRKEETLSLMFIIGWIERFGDQLVLQLFHIEDSSDESNSEQKVASSKGKR